MQGDLITQVLLSSCQHRYIIVKWIERGLVRCGILKQSSFAKQVVVQHLQGSYTFWTKNSMTFPWLFMTFKQEFPKFICCIQGFHEKHQEKHSKNPNDPLMTFDPTYHGSHAYPYPSVLCLNPIKIHQLELCGNSIFWQIVRNTFNMIKIN